MHCSVMSEDWPSIRTRLTVKTPSKNAAATWSQGLTPASWLLMYSRVCMRMLGHERLEKMQAQLLV